MWRLRYVAGRHLRPVIGISLATGLGLVGLGFTQNVENLHDQRQIINEQKRDQDVKFKVGIIGSGIGATSAAYFIRKGLASDVHIDVYEKESKVGGRMSVIEIDGEKFEAGASVIHDTNRYLMEFCELLGLDKLKRSVGTFGIYNGEGFVFASTGYSLLDKLKLFFRYGWSLIRMIRLTSKTMEKFLNVYKIQDDGQCFETVPELLNALGGKEFADLTKESARKVLERNGLSNKVIDELVIAISRNNYGQDMGLNAFAGLIAMAGAQLGDLCAVKGGNYQICEGILKMSGVNLMLNSKVDAISRKKTDENTVKYSVSVNGQASDFVYDVIILAVPIERKSAFVLCSNCDKWPKFEELGHFQKTVATFIKGSLNCTAFGLAKDSSVPNGIFTVENPELVFSTIEAVKSVEQTTIPGGKSQVFKIFSREALDKEHLNWYFNEHEKKLEIPWLAYPHYTPPEKFISFKLDDGVFHGNAIERAASCMEIGAIGGRNAALLALKRLKSTEAKKSPNEES